MFASTKSRVSSTVSYLIVLSLLLPKLVVFGNSCNWVGKGSSHSFNENIFSEFTIQSNHSGSPASRKLNESNSPNSYSFYDKHDSAQIGTITDSKKIYQGGFSESHRLKTFLIIQFSTST
ncbi:MAG: hypothetical protein KF721_14750 [Ignavibacteriaceae bacterium]|nr:hypothetical protein [Ignavibacteriaceae bacterium]